MKNILKNQSIYLKSLVAPAILILTLFIITALFIISTKNQQESFHSIRKISTNKVTLLEGLLLKTEKIQSGVFHIATSKFMNSPNNEIDELENKLGQDISDLKIIFNRIPYQWTLDKYEEDLVKALQISKDSFNDAVNSAIKSY